MFSKSPLIIAIVFFLTAVVILALDINSSLFLRINATGGILPDSIWTHITTFGSRGFALIVFLLFFWKQTHLLRAALLAVLTSALISEGIKNAIALARPPAVLEPDAFHLIGTQLVTNSFPSGHTMTAFAIMGVIAFHFKYNIITLFAILLASLVGLSRIMMGVHWPIDVLVGASLGWVCGWLGMYLLDARIWRDHAVWNYLTYFIYLLVAAYLFYQGTGYRDVFLMEKIVSSLGILLALWSFVWLKKGGNKAPISYAGWLS